MNQLDIALSPPLMIDAPKIAGLLPARAASLVEKETEALDAPSFTYTSTRLKELSVRRTEVLFQAMRTLIDIAVSFALEESNEAALRAAEVVFHRAAGGTTPIRPWTPEAYRAERDAVLVDWWIETSHSHGFVSDKNIAIVEGQ